MLPGDQQPSRESHRWLGCHSQPAEPCSGPHVAGLTLVS